MTLVKRRSRNGNGGLFPTLTSDFFTNSFFTPRLFDFDDFDGGLRMPPVNIEETDKEFLIDLSAPGMKRDDFKVELDNGDLLVSSEKEEETKDDKKNYHRREFSYRSFSRRFPLPDNIVDDKINAKYDNGMLHITVPKKEVTVSKPKKSIDVA